MVRRFFHPDRLPVFLPPPSVRASIRKLSTKDDDSPLDMEGLILRLLLRDERAATGRREQIPDWVLRVREMIREEPNNRSSLTDLSRCVGRHPVQVSRQFHHHFGCTIGEYLRWVRIARSQLLLSCSEIEVSRIALDCGFCDQSHFTSAFRRLTGMPPYGYRLFISNNLEWAEGADTPVPTID
jgi:AraC family transcriptional regulator